MTDLVIATIQKNSKEEIRVTLGTFNGRQIVNLRTWFRGDDGEMRPGKGLACRLDLLPQLAAAMAEAERQARAGGLIE